MNEDSTLNGANKSGDPFDASASTEVLATENAARENVAIQKKRRPAAWAWAPLLALAELAVPGLGHALLRRWGRALAFLCAVAGLVVIGYLMRGDVFPPHSEDPFGTVGFLADAGSGVFFFLSRFFEAAGPDVGRAAGDYGTRFIAAAGIVNVLGAFDTFEIARGRRS
jgi:hypothetical protein